jgi:alpha-beta hydrolase superfamily lysophospholipase
MGGWAAAWYAVRRPGAVAGLVLIAPALDFPHARWQCLSEADRQAWKQSGRHRVQNAWIDVELGYGLVEEMGQFDVETLAVKLARPVAIFHGMRDDIVDFQHSIAFSLRAAQPNLELHLYKSGDHRLVAYREEIAEAACTFLGRVQA